MERPLNTPRPDQLDDEHLLAGLGGAMQWQRIVQDRRGGPEAARHAAGITRDYARVARDRGMFDIRHADV